MSEMLEKATGTSGNPVQDGLTRASWVAAVQAVVAFSVVRWEWLTTEELAILTIPITFTAIAAFGVYDALRQRVGN